MQVLLDPNTETSNLYVAHIEDRHLPAKKRHDFSRESLPLSDNNFFFSSVAFLLYPRHRSEPLDSTGTVK